MSDDEQRRLRRTQVIAARGFRAAFPAVPNEHAAATVLRGLAAMLVEVEEALARRIRR